MKMVVAIVCLLTTVGCSTPDPISALTKQLNTDDGEMWINGEYPVIHLPAYASTTDVLNEAVKMTGFDAGHIKNYKILTTRVVSLDDGNAHEHLAILIDSDLGRKIVLTRYESPITGWWTRFYDVKK